MTDAQFRKVETHETRYVGTLSVEQVTRAITEAVYELVGISRFERGVKLECELFSWLKDCGVGFVLTKDYLCYRVPTEDETGAA